MPRRRRRYVRVAAEPAQPQCGSSSIAVISFDGLLAGTP
jgi:hypothetical protein